MRKSRLIKACIEYTSSFAAWKATFFAKPGDDRNAAVIGNEHLSRSERAMAAIARTKAVTPPELYAKTKAIQFALENEDQIDERELNAVHSLVVDLEKFLAPISDGSSLHRASRD